KSGKAENYKAGYKNKIEKKLSLMKLMILLISAGLWSLNCSGQTDSSGTNPTDSVAEKSTLTLGATYCNNADYYGQKAGENIPYLAASATYRFWSGFYFSGLAYRLLKDTVNAVSAGNLRAGFEFSVSKKISADISYSHTFYPSYSPLLQASNPDNVTASLTYENFLSSKLTGDYAFGQSTDFFLTAGTGKQINLGHLTEKDIITFTPAVAVTAGTQHFYQTYLIEKKLQDSLLGIILPPLTGERTSGVSQTVAKTQFSILSYNLNCPLAYSRSGYMIEFNYQLSLLSNTAESGPGQLNSFFSANFYYQF
ncbi:MAG TPA: hypothetical protein VFI33_12085, partial [Puia sp.]|nr:hypothetical protein [Puia sp.]